MKKTQALTLVEVLVEVLVVAFVFAAIACLVYVSLPRPMQESRRIRCRNNLHQLAKGMATYLNEFGDNRWYPCPLGRGLRANSYSGAEWLATLHWVRTLPDPDVFICPSTEDTNHRGEDLGADRAIEGKFGSQTVSYAAMHYYSLTDDAGNPKPGAIEDNLPAHEPMASDDTEGSINHGERSGGMTVLFFDSHVEFWPRERIDLERGVGMKGGPLWRLRN
jgi:prepilin-type processing-associated H-X9-DG protein